MYEPENLNDGIPLSIPDSLTPLESILFTDELRKRPWRAPDYNKETRALLALNNALTESPQTVLRTLAETILDVTGSDSAGVSLLVTKNGEQKLYWHAIAGVWK